MLEIGLFWEEGFPAEDTAPQDVNGLRRALDGFNLRVLSFTDLDRIARLDLLILPFGSAFPAEGWPLIYAHLRSGGNILNLGGVPFTVPCTREHVVFKARPRQGAYLREAGFRYFHAVDPASVASLVPPPENPILAGLGETVQAKALFALMPDTETPPPALRPLLHGVDAAGRHVASPIVAMDHLDGAFRGGRWVFALLDGSLPADLIRRLTFYAALGASDLTVTPSFPCYYPGETPRLAVHASLVGRFRGDLAPRVTVDGPQGRSTCTLPSIPYGDRPAYRWSECSDALFGQTPLTPGFYTVAASLASDDLRDLAGRLGIPPAAGEGAPTHRSGFWVWDDAVARAGGPLSTSGLHLAADGLPCPAIGVRYEPARLADEAANPSTWDADLRRMSACGIGMVRLDPLQLRPQVDVAEAGPPDEALMRATDALILSARDCRLIVSLDPLGQSDAGPYRVDGRRSAETDLDLLAAFVERYEDVPGVVWEFNRLPSGIRPAGETAADPDDLSVEAAWHDWIAGRDDDVLRTQWRLTTRESVRLFPRGSSARATSAEGSALRQMDVALFSREMARRWLAEVRHAIASHGASGRLVAAAPESQASPHEAASSLPPGSADLAFTRHACHEESTLCRAVLASAGVRPAFARMAAGLLAETPDGCLCTGEGQLRDRLERMLALGMAAGLAGVACSPWKPGMEDRLGFSAGLARADGSATPALRAVADLVEFLSRSRQYLHGYEPETVAMVVPVSHLLTAPDVSGAAVAACIWAFHAGARMPLRAVGEYDLECLGDPRLILLPYPRVLRSETWDALLAKVNAGASLLITGSFDLDPYWHPTDRLAKLGLQAHTRPVARVERVAVGDQMLRLRFGAETRGRLAAAASDGHAEQVVVWPVGAGKLLLAPLPFELADDDGPLAALYDWAVAESGVERPFLIEPADAAVLVRSTLFSGAMLYALLSESSEDQEIVLRHGPGRVPVGVHVPGGRAVMLLVDRASGAVLERYDPEP